MEKLKNWLEKGSLPGDHYELLGLAQFTDDTESVVAAVRKTTKFLHQYQNHKNASFVQHARKLQLLCATAGHTFADVEKWRFYDDGLMKRLSDEFCERKPPVDPRTWLCESQNIASHRLDEVTQFISAQTIVQPATTSTVNGVTTNTSNTSSQRELPFVIQNYEVFERLGEGGIGVVYKARHRRLDKLVAIKFLRNQYSTDASAAARFHREMKAIGKLDHQNIVRATDAGEFGDSKFLVMDSIFKKSFGVKGHLRCLSFATSFCKQRSVCSMLTRRDLYIGISSRPT